MDSISLPVEVDRKKIDSRYRLVIAASIRARQIAQGSQSKFSSKAKKVTTAGLWEVASNSAGVLTGEAAAKAKEKAKKHGYEHMIDEAKQRETQSKDLTEIEKELKVFLSEKSEKTERDTEKMIEDIFGGENSE